MYPKYHYIDTLLEYSNTRVLDWVIRINIDSPSGAQVQVYTGTYRYR